jgi:intracellular septation protein
MTEVPASEPKKAPAKGGIAQLLVDLGPVLVFMISYRVAGSRVPEGEAIYWATGVFLAATALALAYAWFVQRRVPPPLIVTAIIVTLFGGLTIALHDPVFIKIKPTIVNAVYAAFIFGGLLLGKNVWKLLFQETFPPLPDSAWNTFAIRWGLFFVFLAGLNEYIWRNFSEAFWVDFKFFGMIPLTFVFMLANMPLLMKHMPKDDAEKTP